MASAPPALPGHRTTSLDSLYAPSLDALSSSSWGSGSSTSSSSSSSDGPPSAPIPPLGLPARPPLPSPARAARSAAHPLRFSFAQAFGERQPDDMRRRFPAPDADILSAVQFNHQGDLLAAGDRGGRIVILSRQNPKRPPPRGWSASIALPRRPPYRRARPRPPESFPLRAGSRSATRPNAADAVFELPDFRYAAQNEAPKYRFWTQFQSHEPEFDYLKSMEIEERVSQIRWCRHSSGAHHLLATNDKTMKLFRIYEQEVKTLTTMHPETLLLPKGRQPADFAYAATPPSPQSPKSAALGHGVVRPRAPAPTVPPVAAAAAAAAAMGIPQPRAPYSRADFDLQVPRLHSQGPTVRASPRRLFSNAHSYHINSISINCDEATFLSADDLRVNIWSLHTEGMGFNVLDIKPGKMEDLKEVITSAEFHPDHCHLFMHSTSRGSVKLSDLRESALCHSYARTFQEPEVSSSRSSFFSEIIASISDIKFSPCGRYIMTRDFMHLRLWDVNMESQPLLVVPVQERLRLRLCELYDNDCIFDKFQCAFSNDGGSMLTGSYNSLFQSYSSYNGAGVAVEASAEFVSGLSGRQNYTSEGLAESLIVRPSAEALIDPTRKITHLDASPTEPFAAVAAGPALYLYYGTP